MKIFYITILFYVCFANVVPAQEFKLGIGFGAVSYGTKVYAGGYTSGIYKEDFSYSEPRIFALYSFNDKFTAELRLEAEVSIDELVGPILGLLGRYYPHKLGFLQGGVLMHSTVSSSHGMVRMYRTTMLLPAVGLGIQPADYFSIDAVYVFGSTQAISAFPGYVKHEVKVAWMLKIGAGFSFSL